MPPAKPWPFEVRYHVDAVALGEHSDRDGRAGVDAFDLGAKLADRALRLESGLLIMAGERTRDARLLHVAERERDGFVAVGFFRLALHDRTRARFDYRYRYVAPVGCEHARHPDLAADDVLHRRNRL